MPTVTVTFTPLPAHLRTARFIAASVARRAGVAESILDEVRLAVSEACSLAVRQHLAHAPGVPVEVRLTDSEHQFRVEVVDAVVRTAPPPEFTPDGLHSFGVDGPGHADTSGVPDSPVGTDAPSGPGTLSGTDAPIGTDADGSGDLQARERIGLAVISGLVDDFEVDYRDDGSVVTMMWPIEVEPALIATPPDLDVF